jgi:zona occludens toxin (predicted ATPase)
MAQQQRPPTFAKDSEMHRHVPRWTIESLKKNICKLRKELQLESERDSLNHGHIVAKKTLV